MQGDGRRRWIRIWAGIAVGAVGVAAALSPDVVADLLHRPAHTVGEAINLRASWGGTLAGVGAFLVFTDLWRPRWRPPVALLMWTMGGIAAARALGFALDGMPDALQWTWLGLEVALVTGSAIVLSRTRRVDPPAGDG